MQTNSNSGIQALLDLCENEIIISFTKMGENIRIESNWNDSGSVIDALTLLHAQITAPSQNSSSVLLPDYGVCQALVELSDGFRLELICPDTMSEVHDTKDAFFIIFSDVIQNTIKCSALYEGITPFTRMQSPWDYLALIARGIRTHIEYGLASEEELALSGILDFLNQENTDTLFQKISAPEYEPLWRSLYEMFAKTQEGLPSPAEVRFSEEQLQAHRDFVSQELHAQGFEGEYPFFHRSSPIRGLRLFSSYGRSYLTCNKKDAISYIYCKEQSCREHVGMELICGILFESKEDSDIFSCMFDHKGKSSFGCFLSGEYTAYYYVSQDDSLNHSDNAGNANADTDNTYIESHKTAISAAAKSSSLTRLTRTERRHKLTSPTWSSVGFYIILFLFCAFLFGILMMAGFMVIEVIISLIVTRSLTDTAELFSVTPWHLIAPGCGIPFGLLMVISEIIARDK